MYFYKNILTNKYEKIRDGQAKEKNILIVFYNIPEKNRLGKSIKYNLKKMFTIILQKQYIYKQGTKLDSIESNVFNRNPMTKFS